MAVNQQGSKPNMEDDDIIAVFNSIRNNIVIQRQSISEDVFVGIFLPFFLNSPDRDSRISMSTWFSIAGGPYNEVNVKDNARKVIYVVPPIMSNRMVASISGEGGRALYGLLEHAARRDTIIPGSGSALLTAGLTRFDFRNPEAPAVLKEYQQRWLDIIARYSKNPDAIASADKKNDDDGYSIFEFE